MIKIDKSKLDMLNVLTSELYESARKAEDATYYAADELSAIMIKIDESKLDMLNVLVSELYESARKAEDATYYAADELSAIIANCYSEK